MLWRLTETISEVLEDHTKGMILTVCSGGSQDWTSGEWRSCTADGYTCIPCGMYKGESGEIERRVPKFSHSSCLFFACMSL